MPPHSAERTWERRTWPSSDGGTGQAQPQTAAIMADVLGAKLGRRITPGDLGFFDHSGPATPQPVGYPSTLPDVLTMLGGLADQRAEAAIPDDLVVADTD